MLMSDYKMYRLSPRADRQKENGVSKHGLGFHLQESYIVKIEIIVNINPKTKQNTNPNPKPYLTLKTPIPVA